MSAKKFMAFRYPSFYYLILATFSADASAACLPSAPLENMVVTSNWGIRMRPNARKPDGSPWLRPHNGFDLTTNRQNKPLFAAHDGIVTAASFERSQGNHIDIVGSGSTTGIKTISMHLSALHVKAGETVRAGQQIGVTGDSGAGIAGAPHLHYEVRINNGKTPQDPRGYFCPIPSAQANLSDTYDLVSGKLVPKVFPSTGSGPITTAPGGVLAGTQPTTSTSPLATPGVVSMAPGGGIPPEAPFPLYTGKSTAGFFANEVESRFLNTTWITGLIDPLYTWRTDPRNTGKTPPAAGNPQLMLTREIAIMAAISNAMRMETRDVRINTEAMMATMLSMQAQDYSESLMSLIKKNTATK